VYRGFGKTATSTTRCICEQRYPKYKPLSKNYSFSEFTALSRPLIAGLMNVLHHLRNEEEESTSEKRLGKIYRMGVKGWRRRTD